MVPVPAASRWGIRMLVVVQPAAAAAVCGDGEPCPLSWHWWWWPAQRWWWLWHGVRPVSYIRYRPYLGGPDLDIFLICWNVISKVTWFCRVANVSRNKKLEWHNLHISNLNIRLCTSQSARLGHHHVSRTLKGNLTVALTWSSEKNHALQYSTHTIYITTQATCVWWYGQWMDWIHLCCVVLISRHKKWKVPPDIIA